MVEQIPVKDKVVRSNRTRGAKHLFGGCMRSQKKDDHVCGLFSFGRCMRIQNMLKSNYNERYLS